MRCNHCIFSDQEVRYDELQHHLPWTMTDWMNTHLFCNLHRGRSCGKGFISNIKKATSLIIFLYDFNAHAQSTYTRDLYNNGAWLTRIT